MREIKFRAWMNDKPISLNAYALTIDGELKTYLDGLVIEQYTGLKDKNGREIYEGDIIRAGQYCEPDGEDAGYWIDDTIHVVKYMASDFDYPAFDLEPSLDCDNNGLAHLHENNDDEVMEVIGNIHENPELL